MKHVKENFVILNNYLYIYYWKDIVNLCGRILTFPYW